MDIKDLKNFNIPMNESMAKIPGGMLKKIEKTAFSVLKQHLGLVKLLRLLLILKKTEKKFSTQNLDSVREKGLSDEAFIKNIIKQSSFFYALTKIAGKEKALELMNEITEKTAWNLMSEIMPSTEDFSTFDNPFSAVKEYILAMTDADIKNGLHESEVVLDSKEAFQVNVTYCAFAEIPKKLGVMEAALPSCYGDDVFFPKILEGLGLRFVRKGTIARGDDVCDFRFEVIK